jgi:RNA polymerase sigma factor (sigma-70 family)
MDKEKRTFIDFAEVYEPKQEQTPSSHELTPHNEEGPSSIKDAQKQVAGDGYTNDAKELAPRLNDWARIDKQVMEMFGLTSLPNQRLTIADWEGYSKRIASGEQSAIEEFQTRRLRAAYKQSESFISKHSSTELTLEDVFQEFMISLQDTLSDHNEHISGQDLKNKVSWMFWTSERGLIRDNSLIKLPHSYYSEKTFGEQAIAETVELESEYPKSELHLEAIPSETSGHKHLKYKNLVNYDTLEEMDDDSESLDAKVGFSERAELLRSALESLSYRERKILELTYGFNDESEKSAYEIGPMFNISRERVQQIKSQAEKKLLYSAGFRRVINDGEIEILESRKRQKIQETDILYEIFKAVDRSIKEKTKKREQQSKK